MSTVITYQSDTGAEIALTPRQIERLERAGRWPRDARGSEYCRVCHGLHQGEPSMTDEELAQDVGIAVDV